MNCIYFNWVAIISFHVAFLTLDLFKVTWFWRSWIVHQICIVISLYFQTWISIIIIFWNINYFKFKKKKKEKEKKKINITFESKTNNWTIISFCIYILHFHWKSNLILKSIDYLFLNFCFVLWLLCIYPWISYSFVYFLFSLLYLKLEYLLFVCLFVCLLLYLIIIWNTKLKSKLFNQKINITFESKNTGWIEYLCDMIFQKYNSFLNMLNVSCVEEWFIPSTLV